MLNKGFVDYENKMSVVKLFINFVIKVPSPFKTMT